MEQCSGSIINYHSAIGSKEITVCVIVCSRNQNVLSHNSISCAVLYHSSIFWMFYAGYTGLGRVVCSLLLNAFICCYYMHIACLIIANNKQKTMWKADNSLKPYHTAYMNLIKIVPMCLRYKILGFYFADILPATGQ